MKKKTFIAIKKAGDKLGLNVKESETVFSYIKKFGGGFEDFLRYACLYLYTDVRDSGSRKELAAFLMQLDRASLGLTSHIRHILMSLFGIEIATYNNFVSDREYIEKNFKKVEKVLKKGKFDSEVDELRELLDKIKNRYNQ